MAVYSNVKRQSMRRAKQYENKFPQTIANLQAAITQVFGTIDQNMQNNVSQFWSATGCLMNEGGHFE